MGTKHKASLLSNIMSTQFEQQFQPIYEMLQANMPGMGEQMMKQCGSSSANSSSPRCGPKFKKNWKNRCGTASKSDESSSCIKIPMSRFKPEQVQINMNSKGLVTVAGSREDIEDSGRNGQRKVTVMVEETCQLPAYLVDHDLLKQVDSKFEHGFLTLSLPENPDVVKAREEEAKTNEPVEIPIIMEDVE